MTKKIAIIPSYEPTYVLIELVISLKKDNYIIIVIDDGSGENYKKIFEECKKYSYVISYENNKGKGYALKRGMQYVKNNYNDYIIITIDSDGQHKVEDANKLYNYCIEHKDELVTGKRIRSNKTPIKSKIGNGITRSVFKITTGLDVYDTQTGLRCFSNNLIDFMLFVPGERFEYEMNVLLECARNKTKIKELEIQTVYENKNKGTHFKAIKDSVKIYKEIIKFSLSSIVSFVTDYVFFTLFLSIVKNLNTSNIIARVISSIINYSINKEFVFKSKKSLYKSAIQYFLLAVFILIINTIILNVLVIIININPLIAKLLTETILFIISWIIQKNIVFTRQKNT